MRIPFTKMHGLGNDFIIIDGRQNPALCTHSLPISQLANRHFGIGFDQLLILKTSQHADFFCQIFNADGSEASQCGNGLRCVARYIHEEQLHPQNQLLLETRAGLFPVLIQNYETIRVTLGSPIIQQQLVTIPVPSLTTSISLSLISLGNAHAVIKIKDIHDKHIEQIVDAITAHLQFAEGINIGFLQVIDRHTIYLRTFERGVGETLACGSNACAAVTAGITQDWLDHTVCVIYPQGNLLIEWDQKTGLVHKSGPAARVFAGIIHQPE